MSKEASKYLKSHLESLDENDLDNLSKPVLDALKRSEIIHDDDQIYHLEVTKFPTRNEEGVEVIVKEGALSGIRVTRRFSLFVRWLLVYFFGG